MKFEYSKYHLRPLTLAGGLNNLHDREGALVRVTWPNGKFGYADLMPRDELGDPTLDVELENLKKFRLSFLTEQMISLAKIDAKYRSEQKNAFQGAKRIKNNYFIPDVLNNVGISQLEQIKNQNFSSVMIDCGQDFEKECDIVRRILRLTSFLVRLDFNSKADFSIFERFMAKIEVGLRPRIEYIEDPMPFEPEAWKEASRLANLAVESQYKMVPWDNPKAVPPLKALVIRPSRIDVEEAIERAKQHKLKMVITSSLEHPIAIAHATIVASDLTAANAANTCDHDCLYHSFYAPNHFSGSFRSQGPYIIETEGLGIGFDKKFRAIEWTPLR